MQDNHSRAELLKISNERLWPSLTNPSYLVQRRRRQILSQWIERIPGKRLMVLDIGGRYQPYRPLLSDRVESYIALDVVPSLLVDVVGHGQELPFHDGAFDLVIATQSFEYFPEPRLAAAEVHRVLKTGGHLMLSVASFYPRAAEEEHWRYLPTGIKFLLVPFARTEIVPEVYSLGGFLRIANVSISTFAKYSFIRQVVHHTLVPILNLIGLIVDRATISTNDQMTGNYCVLAQK